MIKINLLPIKAAKRREQGQLQILVGAVALTVTILAILAFNFIEEADLNRMHVQNRATQDAIKRLKEDVGDYDLVKAQRDDLKRQENAIKELQTKRSGPVWLMRELSDVLTAGRGPEVNKQEYEEQIRRDPNTAFNPNWEPKRVWLMTYEEKSHQVKLHGGAKSDEDVAEFLKRLKQSAFFSDVHWQQTQPQFDNKVSVSYVTFDVTARVNY